MALDARVRSPWAREGVERAVDDLASPRRRQRFEIGCGCRVDTFGARAHGSISSLSENAHERAPARNTVRWSVTAELPPNGSPKNAFDETRSLIGRRSWYKTYPGSGERLEPLRRVTAMPNNLIPSQLDELLALQAAHETARPNDDSTDDLALALHQPSVQFFLEIVKLSSSRLSNHRVIIKEPSNPVEHAITKCLLNFGHA